MPSLILSKDELIELTGRKRTGAQAKVLEALRVPFRRRPDGSIVVFRADVIAPAKVEKPRPQLRLSALG